MNLDNELECLKYVSLKTKCIVTPYELFVTPDIYPGNCDKCLKEFKVKDIPYIHFKSDYCKYFCSMECLNADLKLYGRLPTDSRASID